MEVFIGTSLINFSFSRKPCLITWRYNLWLWIAVVHTSSRSSGSPAVATDDVWWCPVKEILSTVCHQIHAFVPLSFPLASPARKKKNLENTAQISSPPPSVLWPKMHGQTLQVPWYLDQLIQVKLIPTIDSWSGYDLKTKKIQKNTFKTWSWTHLNHHTHTINTPFCRLIYPPVRWNHQAISWSLTWELLNIVIQIDHVN